MREWPVEAREPEKKSLDIEEELAAAAAAYFVQMCDDHQDGYHVSHPQPIGVVLQRALAKAQRHDHFTT